MQLPRVLMIGGAPMVGKSSVARVLEHAALADERLQDVIADGDADERHGLTDRYRLAPDKVAPAAAPFAIACPCD
jgi:hypothetical protein